MTRFLRPWHRYRIWRLEDALIGLSERHGEARFFAGYYAKFGDSANKAVWWAWTAEKLGDAVAWHECEIARLERLVT